MTMFSGRQPGTRLPDGVTVATYRNYETAQQAINSLAEADIDVSGMALVGSDVRVVERILGKLTWRRVAMAGAMRGLTFGLFLGIVFWLLVGEQIGIAILAMPVLGVAFGMLLGIVTHTLTRKNRQYQSVQQIIPVSFDLVAPREVAASAIHKLGPNAHRQSSPSSNPAAASGSPQQSEDSAHEDTPETDSAAPSSVPSPAVPEAPADTAPDRVPNPLAGQRGEPGRRDEGE